MILVELFRLRWFSVWWAGVIVVLGIVTATTLQHATVDMNGSRLSTFGAPLVELVAVPMILAMIYATSAGLSLNKEGQTLALSWTKPVARPLIALRMMAVDVAAIVGAYVFAWLVVLGVIAFAGGSVVSDPAVPVMIVLSLGVVVMWYALLQTITAGMPSNTGIVIGLLWPGALILSQLNGKLSGTLSTIISILNIFNPLAYLNARSSSAGSDTPGAGYWQWSPDERAIVAWLLACALAAVAIALWTRREA